MKSWEQDESPREVEKKEKSDTMTLSSFPIDPSFNTDRLDLPLGTSAEYRALWHVGPVALQRDLYLLLL